MLCRDWCFATDKREQKDGGDRLSKNGWKVKRQWCPSTIEVSLTEQTPVQPHMSNNFLSLSLPLLMHASLWGSVFACNGCGR